MSAPIRVRKKPVSVEAMYFDGSPGSAHSIFDWIKENNKDVIDVELVPAGINMAAVKDGKPPVSKSNNIVIIRTLEGPMEAHKGWWIIRGVKGEFYPCRKDIFNETYELDEVDYIGD